MSPSTWAVTTGIPAVAADRPAAARDGAWGAARPPGVAAWAGPAGPSGAGLGVGPGVISGNRPAAFPAPISVVTGRITPGTGPSCGSAPSGNVTNGPIELADEGKPA